MLRPTTPNPNLGIAPAPARSQDPALPSGSRLYIAVRADLSPGAQLAQTSHAVADFMLAHPDLCLNWQRTSHSLVVVSPADEAALLDLHRRACEAAVAHVLFREPDLGGEATALALEPGVAAQALCANLPLAGKDHPDAAGARSREFELRCASNVEEVMVGS